MPWIEFLPIAVRHRSAGAQHDQKRQCERAHDSHGHEAALGGAVAELLHHRLYVGKERFPTAHIEVGEDLQSIQGCTNVGGITRGHNVLAEGEHAVMNQLLSKACLAR